MNDNSADSSFLSQETEQKFMENIMIQKLDKKRNINLSSEINKRKKMFNRLIYSKFGRNFFKIKPEAYLDLVDKCKTFYFSSNSKFLNNFPKLKQRILKERKINYNKLLTKIDIGSLLYLSEARKKRNLDLNDQKNERLFAYSRNFAAQSLKDVISDEIYKVKFWRQNSKKNNKLLKHKFLEIFKGLVNLNIEQNNKEENEEKRNLLLFHNENINNEKGEKDNSIVIKENNRYNPINSYYNNILYLNNEGNQQSVYESAKTFENIKESNLNINSIKDSSFPSIINKTNSLKTFSNENKKIYNLKSINPISRNIKTFELKKNIKTSLNSSIKPILNKTVSSFRNKKNIDNKVTELNSQTKLCNKNLYKLINNNQTVFPRKKLKKSEKDFDINYSLSESSKNPSKWKKNNKGTFSYLSYEKLNAVMEKNLKGDKISDIVKEVKDNMTSNGKILKRELRLFPKRVIETKDEYALQMVDKLFSKGKLSRIKMPEIKETVKEKKELQQHKYIDILRDKAKYNHKKIP